MGDRWGDVDYLDDSVTKTADGSLYRFTTTQNFMNNTFSKDEISFYKYDVTNSTKVLDGADNVVKVNTTNNTFTIQNNLGYDGSATEKNIIVNMSNQIEYIFEIHTKDMETSLNSDYMI